MAVNQSLLVSWIAVACIWAAATSRAAGSNKTDVSLSNIPAARRVEGRLTLEYVDGNQRIKNQLTFTEVVDTKTQRSKVSIGHVSYEPRIYYARGKTLLTLGGDERQCTQVSQDNRVLPELDFFLRYSFTDQELLDGLANIKSPCYSPVALTLMHAGELTRFDHSETHRGVKCSVFKALYRRSLSDSPISFDVFIPELALPENNRVPLFAVRESVEGISKANSSVKFGTVLTLDFFYIESIDREDARQMAKLEEELSLPLGRGCSQFLKPIVPNLDNFQSFMMSYVKLSTNSLTSLAYDHEFGYLRAEQHGHSVKLWDLNEDLLYHLDSSMFGTMQRGDDYDINLETCSVLELENPSSAESRQMKQASEEVDGIGRGSLARPYERAGGSIGVMGFLGVHDFAYLGKSTVRELPCLVFETILDKQPEIFKIDFQVIEEDSTKAHDYIVQYFVIENLDGKNYDKIASNTGPITVLDRFWPATINLYARNRQTGHVELRESLDVQDFHWGLYGWQGKPSELFMMPECFNNEDEQVKLELALDLPQLTPARRQTLLTKHRYKFEMDLQAHLFKLFQISRLHLTEYRLTLQRHNIVANLVLSDRKEAKQLSYYGEGELPGVDAFRYHKTVLNSASAISNLDGCVLSASHISGVAMVLFCPAFKDKIRATCTVIHDETEPAIKKTPPTSDTHRPACQVFRYEPGRPPAAATHDIDKLHRLLNNHSFDFIPKDPLSITPDEDDEKNATEKIQVSIQDYDVTREMELLVISGYKFVLPDSSISQATPKPTLDGEQMKTRTKQSNVRAFSSIEYHTVGDCSRMCNLDSSCRSYSYCGYSKPVPATATNEPKCLISSLDLRGNDIEMQLVRAKLNLDMRVTVEDTLASPANSTKFLLALKIECSIYERDFLGIFTRTEESLRYNEALAAQFPIVSSATECARRMIELEDKEQDHHGAAFAYCAHTGTCLSDDNLFGQIKGVASGSVADEDETVADPKELTCQMFRRRYQTYFNVSPLVVKRPETTDQRHTEPSVELPVLAGGIRQIELKMNTVEECARACWTSFGHVCFSFDFCSPGLCLINAAGDLKDGKTPATKLDLNSAEFETRTSCLAYMRDFRWDHLRRDHLIGKHNLFDLEVATDKSDGGGITLGSICLTLVLMSAIVVFFDLGLIVGRNFNDRWDNTSGIRRSHLSESTRNLTRRFRPDEPSAHSNGNGGGQAAERMSAVSKCNIENEIYEDPNAIRMDELVNGHSRNLNDSDVPFNQRGDNREASAAADQTRASSPAAPSPVATKSSPRSPNYIDVPDLI